MRAVLAQLEPVPGDIPANVAAVERVLADHPHAELAAFPELFLGGYDPDRAAERAVAPDGPELEALATAARRHATSVVVGLAARTPRGIANAVAGIDRDGSVRGLYLKTHLFAARERAAFVAGDALHVLELAAQRVGPLICFDVELPEPARLLARAGANVLVTVSANMEPYGPDHYLAARARALDNRRPHLYVNRTGAEAGHRFVGGSAAIGPDGSVLAAAGSSEEVLEVEIDLAHDVPPDVDYLTHLRDDLAVEPSPGTLLQGGI